jgi:transposase
MQFGRKSEKLDHQIEQLELQLEDLQADDAEAEREMPPADRAPRQRAPRKPLPEHLPCDEKVYLPATTDCPACGGNLKQLGEDVSEQLEFVPASFRVIRHVRPKLACACCDAIVQAPAPSRPIERGIAGPGLLAHVLVTKSADHLPLYRQSVIYAREASIWTGRCWPAGSAPPARCCAPWSARSASTYWRQPNCTLMTRQCPCSRQATERSRPGASGPTCGTAAQQVI